MNEETHSLKVQIYKQRSRSHAGGVLVVLGLVFEVILAFVFRKGETFLENWGPISADIFVVIGVFAEIHFAGQASKSEDELQRRSEEKVAESNARAEEAKRDLAKLQVQLAGRGLTIEQMRELQTLKDKISCVWVMPINSAECMLFSCQISMALAAVGIDARLGQPGACLPGYGITIVLPDSVNNPDEHPLPSTFERAGLVHLVRSRAQFTVAGVSIDVPVIVVGEKIIT